MSEDGRVILQIVVTVCGLIWAAVGLAESIATNNHDQLHSALLFLILLEASIHD